MPTVLTFPVTREVAYRVALNQAYDALDDAEFRLERAVRSGINIREARELRNAAADRLREIRHRIRRNEDDDS